MDSTTDGGGYSPSQPTVIPLTDELKQAVAALTGHAGTSLGAVQLDTTTEQKPVKIVVDIYVDEHGHTHVEVSEMWPPDYHIGTVLADVVVGR
jgi:hypothetical protein